MKQLMLAAMAAGFICASPVTSHAQSGIPGVIGPGVEAVLVQEGFEFLEGPLGMRDGGLYFTDLGKVTRINRLDPAAKISMVRENTNRTNGLAYLSNGDVIGAESDGKRIVKMTADGHVSEMTRGDGTRPLMAPNDVIADANDGIYFTDPGPRPVVPGRKAYVYFLPDDSTKAIVIDDTIVRPNGLTVTLDGKTLIVDDTVGDTVFAFDIQRDGTVANKRPFIKLRDLKAGQESGADGLAIDRDGRLFITSTAGVQAFDRAGQYLGTIKVPRQPSNVAFAGPDKSVLYITAREGLYRVQTLTHGPARAGK